MPKRLLPILVILFALLDLGYTFWLHYQLPLEGDLVQIAWPAPECRPVLHDPFGWAALTRHEVYVAPNRFFAHAAMVGYFHTVPLWLQGWLSPISSVYAACALFSVLVQALLLYVLAAYATGSGRPGWPLWLAVALLVPLFQSGGYQAQMGIIDDSITYTFFYAFPVGLLLVFGWPFYRAALLDAPFRVAGVGGWVALALLAVVLSFNGAIIPGIVAVVGAGTGLYWLRRAARQGWAATWQRVPWAGAALLALLGLLCLYSLYIGQFEAERLAHTLPVLERYRRLPQGLNELFRRPGFPIFLGATLLNLYLLARRVPASPESRRVLRLAGWLGLFALVFILLLPLGGYRNYRPFIIRRDAIQPILLGLMVLYAMSSLVLLRQLPAPGRRWLTGWLLVLGVFFTASDNLSRLQNNRCERQALETLARTPQPVVQLPADCTVVSWFIVTDPAASENAAQMLHLWGITWDKRRYYQK